VNILDKIVGQKKMEVARLPARLIAADCPLKRMQGVKDDEE
jgi:hypothetical protein